MVQTKVFISYSWDSTEHKEWVRKLADTLEEIEELHVTWDGYDLDSLVDKNFFMENGICDADLILVVTTKKYKDKADNRSGGVGIETYLASAEHWDGMLRDKKSKLLVLNRENESTPRYLSGHFHLDFNDEALYERNVNSLLDLIRSRSAIQRPKKSKTLASKDGVYEFTKIEELIRVNHPNRRAIVNTAEGTDYSGSNRIKYELWETKSPRLGYFLALHANINITQTARHAVGKLRAAGLKPTDITVLRHRHARPEQELISTVFVDNKFTTDVYECTYKEYIWDYCIDEALKDIEPPTAIENYTNQSLSFVNSETGEVERITSALDHMVDSLMRPSDVTAYLIVAPGGMGKTSLCLSVAKKLNFRNDLRSSVILIQAESIKRYIADNGIVQSRIDSVYDIYELYAKHQGHSKLFDRSTFDLAVVCGNLTVIIDGLDELSSLFQDKFDIDAFLESLKQLHDQLGSSNVLLTTRNNVVAVDAGLEELSIAKYELLGFDANSCNQYVSKRLQGYSESSSLVQKVMRQIAKVRLQDHDGRIVPFLADIATTVVEDELKEGKGREFELSEDLTPYPSNNNLTDHIVHSILRREETRQELDISVTEVVEIISGLVVDFGKRWPAAEMLERLQILYETRARSIFSKLSLNPLLLSRNGDLELRYSFLSSYFEVALMLQGILGSSLGKESIRSLAKLSADSEEATELRRYFTNHPQEVEAALKPLIQELRKRAVCTDIVKVPMVERENAKRAIASLLQLIGSAQKRSMNAITEKIFDLYGIPNSASASRTLDGLFIKGDFPALDFTNLVVTNSHFQGYKNLLASRFLKSMFIYSVFEDCGDAGAGNTSLESAMIDSTCDVGDLKDVFALSRASKGDEKAIVQAETTRFLHSFFRGDRFADVKVAHIKFSTKMPGLAPDKFNRLLAEGFIVLSKEKTVASFYEISSAFKPSVRKYLVDGYPDAYMKKFFTFIR
jgi:hypothetical protein